MYTINPGQPQALNKAGKTAEKKKKRAMFSYPLWTFTFQL